MTLESCLAVFFGDFFYIASHPRETHVVGRESRRCTAGEYAMKKRWDVLVYCWLAGWSLVFWGVFGFDIGASAIVFLTILFGSTLWFFVIQDSMHRKRNAIEQVAEETTRTRMMSSIHWIQIVVNLFLFLLTFYVIFAAALGARGSTPDWELDLLPAFYPVVIAISLIGARVFYGLGRRWIAFSISFIAPAFLCYIMYFVFR